MKKIYLITILSFLKSNPFLPKSEKSDIDFREQIFQIFQGEEWVFKNNEKNNEKNMQSIQK